MAIFRVKRTKDYTVMSNSHLRDTNLSLKAKGLLSLMLSLPEQWNYTTRGLAAICKEGVEAIGSALKELETAGYILRRQLRGRDGRISDTEYTIYEQPCKPDTPSPDADQPDMTSPDTENPDMDASYPANHAQLSKDRTSTDGSSTDSILFRADAVGDPPEPKRKEAVSEQERENYRTLICENIGYDRLRDRYPYDVEAIDEIVELMLDVICAKRRYTRVSGSDFSQETVKSRLLKLDFEHIQFVLDGLRENITKVRNIKQYLLAALYNAPITISNYYAALVSHDMNAG